jgi:phosphoribosyl 1,2-cyclic phosphate phosphodiesterase
MKVKILGSGTSTGIPMLGCDCEVCTSSNQKNKRLRTSFLIETNTGKNILIDTTPDLRTQLLRENITHIDAVIITHDHADHVHGIDDLRPLCFGRNEPIPVYTYKECADALRAKFPYIFEKSYFNKDKPVLGGGIPKLELHEVKLSENTICGETVFMKLLPHGHTQTLGIIINGLAITVDCAEIPSNFTADINKRGIDIHIIDCVNTGSHQTHMTVETAFDFIRKSRAKKTGLIHMGHKLDHDELEALCRKEFPDHSVFVTFDQQQLIL